MALVRQRLEDAGIALPAYVAPRSQYKPIRRFGDVVYCAGVTSDGITGRVSADGDLEHARAAARLCACRQLAALEACLGALEQVAVVLRVTGYVACEDGFTQTPEVMDAASEVFIAAYGEAGQHVRSAIGVRALPGDCTVELDLVVAVSGQPVPAA